MSALVPVRLAVVGSTGFGSELATACAATVIHLAYAQFRDEIAAGGGCVVSGGAHGVDTWAETVAVGFGWTRENGKFVAHLPNRKRWEPDGFKARNQLIAGDCTHLLRLYRPDSPTYGSGWTADRAEALGKVVRRFVWDPEAGRFVKVEPVVSAS